MFSSHDKFAGEAFGPELTAVMDEAYKLALKHLHDKGQPDAVREIIANRVIQLARNGEHDPDVIARRTLISLGFRQDP